ncbi:efflux RND transporter periplasmic adaptor subunit [soil metagenome]
MNENETKIKLAEDKPDESLSEFDTEEISDKESSDKSPNKKYIWRAVGGTFLLLIIAFFWWQRSKNQTDAAATDEAEKVVSVKVAKVERQPIAQEVAALGTIFASEQADVSSNLNAQIKQMNLLKNAVVKKGDVLAILESRDLQAQLAESAAALQEAKLNLSGLQKGAFPQTNIQQEKDLQDAHATVANAKNLYERRKDLYDKGGIALKEVEASQLALTTAENNLRFLEKNSKLRANNINPNDRAIAESKITQVSERIKAIDVQMSYTTIRAPITGIVTNQFQFEGEFATQGGKLVTISDISQVIVKAQFADSVAANLKVGDAVEVLPTDLQDERMSGKVSLISRSSDIANRSVEIWVELGNDAGRLRVGSAAEVKISANYKTDALVVPTAAVTLDASNGDEGMVMIVDADNLAHERKVKVGLKTSDKTQIVEGLKEGDTVVTEGNYALPDGTKVEIAKDEAAEGN